MSDRKETIALAFAAVLTAISVYEVPSWHDGVTDVCHLAAIVSVLTIAVLCVTRQIGRRGVAIERLWAAGFLAGMPPVYITRWLVTGGGGTSSAWLWVELGALPLFALLAGLGLWRWPRLLAVGIAAHGLAWDSWHYAMQRSYTPAWYTIGCLLVDVGLGVYLLARIPAWSASQSASEGSSPPIAPGAMASKSPAL